MEVFRGRVVRVGGDKSAPKQLGVRFEGQVRSGQEGGMGRKVNTSVMIVM